MARTTLPSPDRDGGSLERDTIAAVATPSGRGGIGIVRVSGPLALTIVSSVCGRELQARIATFVRFRDAAGQSIDQGIALAFPAPMSFTGESVAEFHGHGGPMVMDMLLNATLSFGARLAQPGEFTARAFLNGKMDLTQAEAVADLIASRSEAAARGALRSLSGAFSAQIHRLAREMLDLRVYVEGAIDFPEDEIDFVADGRVGERLERLVGALVTLIETATQGAILNEGITLVLAGRPNVGKSSLLNRLLGFDRAIVTDTPGTTRDTLSESMDLEGVPLRVIDTAGLRIAGDAIEKEGIRRARLQIDEADLILLVRDSRSTESVTELVEEQSLPSARLMIVTNKIDLTNDDAGDRPGGTWPDVGISALTGAGVDVLKRNILRAVGRSDEVGVFSARRRHLEALSRARMLLVRGAEALQTSGAGELLADDLRRAHDQLGAIVGSVSSDALLGEIFSRFCIGK